MLLCAMLLMPALCSGEDLLWQIGIADGRSQEFALAGKSERLIKTFGGERTLVYEIGKSTPGVNWPYVQPGIQSGLWWGKECTAERTIRFTLAEVPRGRVWLRLDLLGVLIPNARFRVTINGRVGQLEPEAAGGNLADDRKCKTKRVELEVSSKLLRAGANELKLELLNGGWVIYDALAMLSDPDTPEKETTIANLGLKATSLFVRQSDKLWRVVDATLKVSGFADDVAFRVEHSDGTGEFRPENMMVFGVTDQELLVPENDTNREVRVTVIVNGKTKSATIRLSPCRKWKIFVAASAHTDIGYTDLQPKVAELHNRNTDKALELLGRYPDFAWNLEISWQLENYLAARPGPQIEKFLALASAGKVGVSALYAHMLTGILSHEAATRLTWFSAQAHRRYGVPYAFATITDTPSQEWSMPSILANSGIRYLSIGLPMNGEHAGGFAPLPTHTPCWWEGPDGSRVLTYFASGYAQAERCGLAEEPARARPRLLGKLGAWFEGRKDYPYDAILLHGALRDNAELADDFARAQAEWNRKYAFPQLIYCTPDKFFRYIEEHYAAQLPVIRGSGGTYWDDGAGSSAHETRLNRNAEAMLTSAGKLLSLVQRVEARTPYPGEVIEQTWRNCLLYDEHTWGSVSSVRHPDSSAVADQWAIKAGFATNAHRSAQELSKQAVGAWAANVRHKGPALVVVNSSSWPRTDLIRMDLPAGLGVADPAIPVCRTEEGTCYVLVKDAPACGYRTIGLASSSPVPAEESVDNDDTLDSPFYRVRFDGKTGSITSLVDKQSGREWVDSKAPYRLNEYLHVLSQDGTTLQDAGRKKIPDLQIGTPRKAILRKTKLGSLGVRMRVETSAPQTPSIVSLITVWNDLKRVDFENRLTKTATREKEAAYFAFPFAAPKAIFRYEIPLGVVRPDKDMLHGACMSWFTIQNFVEVEASDGAVVWSSPDAPLACFQDINRGLWPTTLTKDNGHVYSYVMNNYWWTNYKAEQGGDFVFRYSFTSRSQSDPAESARFGASVAVPLEAVFSPKNESGAWTAETGSMLSISEPNVVLFGMRQASGGGVILHLRETAGKATVAHLRVAGLHARKATLCNLVEEPQGPLELRDGEVQVPLRGWGLAAVRIE
jgi:hypothetical protein